MKKVAFIWLFISLIILCKAQTKQKIVIIHTNDLHSRLTGFAPESAYSYILEFFVIIKKMSLGLINVVPKDAEGDQIADMKNAVIDLDENKGGIQEGKEWLALMEYLSSMKDPNANGIPEIGGKYKKAIQTLIPVK